MSWVVSAAPTTDAYQGAGPGIPTIQGMTAVYCMVQVNNAAVMMSKDTLIHGVTSTGWGPDLLLLPGVYMMRRRLRGIRFRSAVAGMPALVSIEALSHGE